MAESRNDFNHFFRKKNIQKSSPRPVIPQLHINDRFQERLELSTFSFDCNSCGRVETCKYISQSSIRDKASRVSKVVKYS